MKHIDSTSQKKNECREFVKDDASVLAEVGQTHGGTAEQSITNPSNLAT